MLPLGSASPLDMITRDFNERPLIPWHQTSTDGRECSPLSWPVPARS